MKFIIKTNDLDLDIEKLVDQDVRKLALDLYNDLVANTPVDSGALRNAWEVDTNAANPSVSNPLPYAHKVMEGGHSQQAPSGTLSTIIDKFTD